MKKSEVQIGGRYHAKVSGCLAVVRVTEMKEVPPPSWAREGRWRTVIYAVNEATGRKVTIRSPQRLRPLPKSGCEFCRQSFNRSAGDFTCPYCGKRTVGVVEP